MKRDCNLETLDLMYDLFLITGTYVPYTKKHIRVDPLHSYNHELVGLVKEKQ